jgi:hypothetical protein
MSEMVERVEAAIKLAWFNGGDWPDFARAAIEAMREPTEAMLAGFEVNGHPRGELVADWQYLIDRALKPPNCP